MALKLFKPGTISRTSYVARGWVGGVLYEKSLRTADGRVAKEGLRALVEKLTPKTPGRAETFAQAAQRYVDFRNPSHVDRQRIDAVVRQLGTRRLRDITPGDLHEMAVRMLPDAAPATRNRNALRPAITILHYAANAGLCPYLRVKTFKEPRPKTRAVERDLATALIEAAEPGPKRLLVTWLFCQGTRISDTLRVKWDDIDLDKGTVRVHVSKTDTVLVFPLHENVHRELLGLSAGDDPYVFPWRSRSSVRWLRELGQQVGVNFTAHMARHSLATWLAQDGAALRTIMDALGHADVHSSMRYQGSDVETVRAAINKVGRIA